MTRLDAVDDRPSSEGVDPRLRVVVVDDYAPVRELVAEILPSTHCIVVGQAADGEQALALLAGSACDLVVMDINMPVMDGVEATRAITRQHPNVKVVAFTSADPDAARQMIDAGATTSFDKKAPIMGLIDYVIREARHRLP
jgi:CheY-like chemotaxis protein